MTIHDLHQVLVVDDQLADMEPVKSALEQLGASVRCAEELDSAQRELEQYQFDLVVTDLCFRAVRGRNFLDFTQHKFARTVADKDLPLVVVSNMSNLEFACELVNTQRLVGHFSKDKLTKEVFRQFLQKRFGCFGTLRDEQLRTWLHISDLHFGMADAAQGNREAVEKAFFTDIDRIAAQIDIVFITGDVAFSGRSEQYAEAMLFLTELRKRLDPSVRLYMVPGNHDKERARIPPNLRKFRVATRDEAASMLNDRALMSMATGPFGAYADFAREVMGTEVQTHEDLGFARVDPKSGIGVVGLNSALVSDHIHDAACDDALDQGSLFIGEQVAEERLDRLSAERCPLLVTLMHHPLAHLADFDRSLVQGCLMRHRSMLLHGHLHRAEFDSLDSLQGRLNVTPCGSLYQGREQVNSYNIGRINLKSSTMSVTYRRYSDVQRAFVKDLDTTGEARDGQFKVALLGARADELRPASNAPS